MKPFKGKWKNNCSICGENTQGKNCVFKSSDSNTVIHEKCFGKDATESQEVFNETPDIDAIVNSITESMPQKPILPMPVFDKMVGITLESVGLYFFGAPNMDEVASLRTIEYIMQQIPSLDGKLYLDPNGKTLSEILGTIPITLIMGRDWDFSQSEDRSNFDGKMWYRDLRNKGVMVRENRK